MSGPTDWIHPLNKNTPLTFLLANIFHRINADLNLSVNLKDKNFLLVRYLHTRYCMDSIFKPTITDVTAVSLLHFLLSVSLTIQPNSHTIIVASSCYLMVKGAIRQGLVLSKVHMLGFVS